MDVGEPRFSMAELVESSGLQERTIRYYISQGIVDPALGRGRSRYFTPRHLVQLEQVARLRKLRLSIEEIRARLAVPAVTEPAAGDRWDRIALHPSLELHLREDAPEAIRALARQVVDLAQDWLGEPPANDD